jgi:hypothetical protein
MEYEIVRGGASMAGMPLRQWQAERCINGRSAIASMAGEAVRQRSGKNYSAHSINKRAYFLYSVQLALSLRA